MSNSTKSMCEKEGLVSLLKTFISFQSTAERQEQKQECLDWIATAFLSDALKDIQRGIYETSPWIYLPHPESKLLVFAHADVVPATEDQFIVNVDGDKAWGRGVSDMKGNILPFLMAYKDAVDTGSRPPVSILITTDEEVGGDSIPYLLDEGIVKEPIAFTPDCSDKGIVCQHKGICWSELVVTGKGGHGAYPWDTENPVWLLAEALQNIQKAFPPGKDSDWQMTVSPTVLSGSNARNQVPEQARCGLDIRYPPEQYASPEEAIGAVQEVLPEHCVINPVRTSEPLNTDTEHPMVQLYKDIAEEVVGKAIPFRKEHGGTDARCFFQRGIPGFLYGPEGGGIHSEQEWVSISSLQQHYEIYEKLFAYL